MTTFQDQPLSRRAVRQNERDQAEPDATSVDAAAAPEAPAEPLTYATQSRPPVPEYDGPSFRVRTSPADGDAAAEVPAAPAAPSEGGYRPRDFSPEGRRAGGAPSWAPQYGGVGDDGALEYQTQGRVPLQPAAETAAPQAETPAESPAPATGSLAASLGAPADSAPTASAPAWQAPAPQAPAAPTDGSDPVDGPTASDVPAAALSPIDDDVLGPIEHTLTRRELRALRDAQRLRTGSMPTLEPTGDLAPQAAPSSRLDSAVAEFDALAQAREASGVDEAARPAPRGRRAYAPATNEVPAEPVAPVAAESAASPEPVTSPEPETAQPEAVASESEQAETAAQPEALPWETAQPEAEQPVAEQPDAPAAFDEDAAFADPALYTQPVAAAPVPEQPSAEQPLPEQPAAEQPWPAEPIPLVEPPAYGYATPQPVAHEPEPQPDPEPQVEPEPQPEPEYVDTTQDTDVDPQDVAQQSFDPAETSSDSPLSAFEALFAPPAPPEPAVAEPDPAAPAFEHAGYAQPEAYTQPELPADELPADEQPAYEQPAYEQPAYEQPVYAQPLPEQPVYAQPPVAETVYAVPEEPIVADAAPEAAASDAEAPAAEPVAEIPVIYTQGEAPSEAVSEPAPVDEIVVPAYPADPAASAPVEPTESTITVTDVVVDPSAPSVGHWSTQAELEDETQHGSATLAGGVGIGSAPLTTSALVLPSIPDQFGPNTGEVLVTGSISLPESFSVTGAHPAQLDQSDLDHMLDPGDHQVASTDSQPVRAIRAVSTHTSSRNVISTTKPKGNRALTVLIVAASAMAAVVITLLVVGLASGQL